MARVKRKKKKKKKPQLSPEAIKLVAQRFRILGEATRLQMLQELFEGELTVQELCERTDTGQANASKHLSILAREGVVSRRKAGLYVYYAIADDSLRELCELVCGSLAERFERVASEFG